MTVDLKREPWPTGYEWIWNRNNARLSKTATLEANLTSTRSDLRQLIQDWLSAEATPQGGGVHASGGVTISVIELGARTSTLHLSSHGEDTLESLDYVAQDFFKKVIKPNADVLVGWAQLPLRS